MNRFSLQAILIILSVLVFNSCARDSDFGLDEESTKNAMVEASLVVSNLDAKTLLNFKSGNELERGVDTMSIDFGTSGHKREQMTETTLNFKVINTFTTDFKLEFDFLNDYNDVQYSLEIPISKGASDDAISVETTIFIEEPEIESFKNSTKVIYKVTSAHPTDLDAQSKGTLSMQSKAIFFFTN